MEDEKSMEKVDVALATCNKEHICQSYIFFFLGNQKIVNNTGMMKNVLEEEFPIQETVVPKWSHLLDQAALQPYQQLFQRNSRDISDKISNLWFPSPLIQSL